MIRGPLDEGDEGNADDGYGADRETGLDPERQRSCLLMRDRGADVTGDGVSDHTVDRGPELPFCESRTGGRLIIESRADSDLVSDDLRDSAQDSKRGSERPPVEVCRANRETRSADRAGDSIAPDAVIGLTARLAGKLPGQCDPVSDAACYSKKGAKGQTVTGAKEYSISDRSGEGAQGSVFAAQKVVGKIERTQTVERTADDTDDRKGVFVHPGLGPRLPQANIITRKGPKVPDLGGLMQFTDQNLPFAELLLDHPVSLLTSL